MDATITENGINTEKEVRDRYADASQAVEPKLCCAVDYDAQYLDVIPQEILDKDYGCGDPSKHIHEGDVVLDLGSGGGKICYIASQITGPKGKVIGVDFNPPMLDLAKRHQKDVAAKIGWDNVEFKYGKIQDLRTDYAALEAWLDKHPVKTAEDLQSLEDFRSSLHEGTPLIADDSIDVIVSNCVLNLVKSEDKSDLFKEMFRVLKRGGRIAISDIVSDEVVPDYMRNDPELWSGCISGAYRERDFLLAFEEAGFYGMEIVARDEEPWQVVDGIEFRSVTVTAHKGKEGVCLDGKQAVIYKGPWKEVVDDNGHRLKRGDTAAVCQKTFQIMNKDVYKDHLIHIHPKTDVDAGAMDERTCTHGGARAPAEIKGHFYDGDGD